MRARQDRIGDKDRSQVVPILLHGDASFSGQGVVMESLQMSQTRGFNVGGTIHIIVNNQIGFTTSNINDSRSTDYSSDVAKIIQAPVIHVNGDDPEMVVNAAKIACKYRNKFKKDIVIDLFCYRRRGHNEADDPSATQPLMYNKISKHPSVLNQYETNLIDNGILTSDEAKKIKSEYRKSLEGGESVAKNLAKNPNDRLWFDWEPYMDVKWWPKVDTKFNKDKFMKLGKVVCKVPKSFNLGSQAKKIFDDRLRMNNGEIPINSVEGFIRQVLGWREFIKGVYWENMPKYKNLNFWSHKGKLNSNWYEGTTGIPPLDDAINESSKFAYSHHINRLMIIANLMNLTGINPNEMYRWFMEMYIDSYDWVMVPNVYGMGSYADGGIFSTKPYICGSSYMLKMSNYKKDEWCDTVDGLYWRFVEKNINFFKTNPRLAVMTRSLEKMNKERKKDIFKKAEIFIKENTL